MIRPPAVAGSFYPENVDELNSQLDSFLISQKQYPKAKGMIVPHAGYVYSGAVAGEVISSTKIPRDVILIGPNHHGLGPDMSVSGADSWSIPLGHVPVEQSLRHRLINEIPHLRIDDQAHKHEHSLEIMLPLLLRSQPDLHIVPIALGHLSLAECLELGSAIARIIKNHDKEVLLLASTDMNHFSEATTSQKLDSLAIDAMIEYDPQRLYRVVRENQISMCGVLPTITVMQAASDLGASHCGLIRYAHSGQVNGDNSRVVGYAGLVLE